MGRAPGPFYDNGQTGLDLARSESPDLILLDIMMPGMDGFEVCQKLWKTTAQNRYQPSRHRSEF